jgi:CHASE3 domain sensor protein
VRTLSKNLIRIAIAFITTLLIANFYVTKRNNQIIEENRRLQHQAEQVKVTVSQFAIIIIHNLDLGLRSFALFKNEKYLYPLYVANRDKDSIIQIVEHALIDQKYPLAEFYQLRDSINSYVALNNKLLTLFQAGNLEEFFRLADQDKGYHLWLQYEVLAGSINQFENEITSKAQVRLNRAESINFVIQLLLFFVCVPTLLTTAYHTYKKFAFEVMLRKSEAEKAEILQTQNEKLEQIVQERTMKIQHQNVALIASKKEQLDLYSRRLLEKSELIEQLSNEIETLKKKSVLDQDQVQNFSKVLHSTILTDDDWEEFKKAFENVYPNFFAALRFRFIDITAAELRLAALIKMNLSLKEAANTLGISADSVKKSRYRLKKKIALAEEDSLEEFIRAL